MVKTHRIEVSPDVLRWAISNGEKSFESISKNYPIDKWLSDDEKKINPTFKQLQNFSRDTRIPFDYFLSNDMPKENFEFVNYRTVKNVQAKPSRRLIETIYSMESLQEWMKDYYFDQGISPKITKIEKINRNEDVIAVANKVRNLLDLDDLVYFKNNSRRKLDDREYFNLLRSKVTSLNVMVMMGGFVGTSTRRTFDINEFRAFALQDSEVPLIFINSKDSQRAKIFSLIHELIHILAHENELLNIQADNTLKTERWINQVVENVLIPKKAVTYDFDFNLSDEKNVELIANKYHLSNVATAIRLFNLKLISENIVDLIKEQQDVQMIENMQKKQIASDSAQGNYWNTVASRVDKVFANAVINYESQGYLSINKASAMLGVTAKSYAGMVEKIIGME